MTDGPDREYCCDDMADAVGGWAGRCEDHRHAHECPDALVSVFADGEHGIIVHDGGTSHVAIAYCPWCGVPVGPPHSPGSSRHPDLPPVDLEGARP